MPKTLDSYLADRVLTRQLYLMRFSAGEKKKVLAVLTQMQKELRLKLMGDLTDFSKARVNKLLSESTAIIESTYGAIMPGTVSVEDLSKMAGVPLKADRTFYRVARYQDSTSVLARGIEKSGEWYGRKASVYFADTKEDALVYGELMYPGKSVGITEVRVPKGTKYIIDEVDAEFGAKRSIRIERNIPKEWVKKVEFYDADGDFIYAREATKVQSTDLLGLARHEAQATASTFAAIGLEASLPTEAVLKALVNGSLIEGAPSSAWWAKQSNDLAFKFAAQVRQGIAQNETMTQIVRRVAGSEKLGIPGIFEGARQNAFALVHTSVMQVASDARLATYRANSDIIKGVRQLSTMDGHTTPTCVAYSGAEWDLDGNPINGTTLPFNGGPPRHWGCRSVLTSITKTFKEMGIKGLPELPDTGERASDLGPIDRNTTMDQFLKMHDTDWQDKMLGKGKAQLWRDGKITLSQLVDGTGRELTLEELKAL